MIKPLLAYLQAKDIPEVLNELQYIPCDKLYVKYYAYPNPHRIIREYFLSHPEYTHLCIVPPDLIVTEKNYWDMYQNVVDYPFISVISGVCNVDLMDEKDYWACTKVLPGLQEPRVYDWYHKDCGLKGHIFTVPHSGFVFPWISRHVIERLTLNGERPGYDGTFLDGSKDGFASDLLFSHSLWNNHVPQYVDSNVEMKHLRYEGEMMVGVKDPHCLLYKGRTAMYLNVTDECERLCHITHPSI